MWVSRLGRPWRVGETPTTEGLGCRVAARAEWEVGYWFGDVESPVFWLKAVPLPEPFETEKHWQALNRIMADVGRGLPTEPGIETNDHRELLMVRKA